MKVNAGIKSKEELRQRLESGETGLILGDLEMYYNDSNIYRGNTPFCYKEADSSIGHWVREFNNWDKYAEVEKQVSWEDEVSQENPVLCWVSDKDKEKRRFMTVIKGFNSEEYGYEGISYRWKYATPIKPSECWGYEE